MISLVLFLVSTAALPAAIDPFPSPDGEDWTYPFSRAAEFSDFEAVSGTWAVRSGNLACSSKGPADEVAWRRALHLPAQLRLDLAGQGPCTIRLTSAGARVDLWLDRSERTFRVRQAGKVLGQGFFLTPRSGALAVTLDLEPGQVSVQVGEDKVHRVPLAEPLLGAGRLSLLSHRAQARFAALTIRRAAPADDDQQDRGRRRLAEDRALALEDARRLGGRGRWTEAWRTLQPLLDTGERWREQSPAVLRLVNQVALEEPGLRREEPLAGWLAATRVSCTDGTVSVQLPLDGAWTAEVPVGRRLDGVLWRLHCRQPELTVEGYRYDHRTRYTFGEAPRTVLVPGSSAAALARARTDDALVELTEASLLVAPTQDLLRLGGETATASVLRYLAGPGRDQPRERRDYVAAYRGNAHRLTIEAAPEALAARAVELRWILSTLAFHPPGSPPAP